MMRIELAIAEADVLQEEERIVDRIADLLKLKGFRSSGGAKQAAITRMYGPRIKSMALSCLLDAKAKEALNGHGMAEGALWVYEGMPTTATDRCYRVMMTAGENDHAEEDESNHGSASDAAGSTNTGR
jgi:hypothetical protein